MKKNTLILSTGFALFSMFFGSGNLVFPLLVGQKSEGHFALASLGILLTGVIVPLLGVLAMMLCRGSLADFFRSIGKTGTFIFSLVALTLMGPLGVLPRCLTVAHGALQLLIPSTTLIIASFAFCVIIYFLTANKSKIIPVLGTILTPLLLIAIFAIGFFAIMNGPAHMVSANGLAWPSFKIGFFLGYQTMDLMAAFFFSSFILDHIRRSRPEGSSEKSSLSLFLKVGGVGGGLLGAVYCLLVYLGSLYSPELVSIPSQEMLGYVALRTLGPFAAPVLCVAIVLACLTTGIVLASLFSEFLRKDILKEKINNKVSLGITILIAFCTSTIGFSGVMTYLGPVIEMIYPSLITLTIVNIAHRVWGFKNTHWPTTLTLAAKLCMAI